LRRSNGRPYIDAIGAMLPGRSTAYTRGMREDERAPVIHGDFSVPSTEVVDPAALTSSGIVIKGDLAESLTSRK